MFDISIEDVWNLYIKQNGCCYYSGKPIFFRDYNKENLVDGASIDRINSKLGYIKTNIVLCHKDVNLIKWDLSLENFYKYCQLIVKNNKEKI